MAIPVISRSRVHNYRLRTVEVFIPHLPEAYEGFKIGQLSDLHLGSFKHVKAVERGVETLMAEDPDMVLFTGDLVNKRAKEVREHDRALSLIDAPYGVYSILGNHDYGERVNWTNRVEKSRNFRGMIEAHRSLGWDLLLNENRIIHKNGAPLAVIGVENWGREKKFMKYGDIDEAARPVRDIPTKLLMTHDPTHWEHRVRGVHPGIDLTFAGHTHGFQFGIEGRRMRWSPSQYLYRYWAGLYHEEGQYLYVNRGFGYLHFKGRIGVLPEITMAILRKGPYRGSERSQWISVPDDKGGG